MYGILFSVGIYLVQTLLKISARHSDYYIISYQPCQTGRLIFQHLNSFLSAFWFIWMIRMET